LKPDEAHRSTESDSMKKAVFIDRDGTINVDVKYMSRVKDLKYYPGVLEGIKLISRANYLIVIITNQSGIARGLFTENKLNQIHQHITADIVNAGGKIDGIYFCPHHPDEGCRCRKPETLMFERAIKDLGIDICKSYMVGDRMLDIEAGFKMGCRTVLVPEKGHENDVALEQANSVVKPNFKTDNFLKAAEWIVSDSQRG
jgi:D-glycero-D-manno-heptose 1,7-bisphosphate phosphatase